MKIFNQKEDNLPKTLKTLIIDSKRFDQSLDKLPHQLEELRIRCNPFNKNIKYNQQKI